MQWQRLMEIPVDDFLEPALKKSVEAVNLRVRETLDNRAAFEATIAEAKSGDPLTTNFDNLMGANSHRVHYLGMLQAEVRLRHDIAALEGDVVASITKAADAAGQRSEKARSDVRRSLVKIGYVNAEPTEQVVGKIWPGMIAGHPRVQAAEGEAKSLQSRTATRDLWRENQKAIDRLEARLRDEIKRHAPAL